MPPPEPPPSYATAFAWTGLLLPSTDTKPLSDQEVWVSSVMSVITVSPYTRFASDGLNVATTVVSEQLTMVAGTVSSR